MFTASHDMIIDEVVPSLIILYYIDNCNNVFGKVRKGFTDDVRRVRLYGLCVRLAESCQSTSSVTVK